VPTGSIKVTSSLSGLKFSIDGVSYTNTNGIFPNLQPGIYQVTAKNAGGCISASTTATVSSSMACASIGDYVFKDLNANGIQDANETGMASVTVKLMTTSGTTLATTTTDNTGKYAFLNLTAGTYTVSFVTPAGYMPTSSNQGPDDAKDSDPVNGLVSNIQLSVNQVNYTVDAGFIPAILSLGSRVWYDKNNDGLNNSSETGVAGLTVKLYRDSNNDNEADGTAIATTSTDASGNYSFNSLEPGNYVVGVILPAGFVNSAVNGGDPDNNVDLDNNGRILFDNELRGLAITLANGTEPANGGNANNSYDFGILPGCDCINTPGNLLTNGSFENGTTGWNVSNGSFTTETNYAACGLKNGSNTYTRSTSTVYQDVTISAGTKLTFTGYAGMNASGLNCSPKLSLLFLKSNGSTISQVNAVVTQNVDASSGQLALYTISATAPNGSVKLRVQSTITCGSMKMDAFCLRVTANSRTYAPEYAHQQTSVDISESLKEEPVKVDGLTAIVGPNPANSFFNLWIRSNIETDPVHIRIFDGNGKAIMEKKQAANSVVNIQTIAWPDGIYLIELIQADQRKLIKLMKKR
jgi:hypothetical protein